MASRGSKLRLTHCAAAIGAALFSCVVLSSSQALAEDAPHAQARDEFERGVTFARQGRWLEAERAFDAAWVRMHTANSAFNLAVARYHVGAFAAAERALDDYDAIAGTDVSKRAEAQRLRQLLLGKIARLTLRVAPAEAQVRIDGQVQPGSGDRRVFSLDPGEHALHMTSEGHAPATRSIRVDAAEQTSLAIVLEPSEVRTNTPEAIKSVALPLAAAAPRARPADAGAMNWTALALGAGGAAGLIASGVLALAAVERNSDSKASCDGNDCSPAGHAARKQARALGNAATVAGLAGGALVLAGCVVWLSSGPTSNDTHLAASASSDGLGLDLRGAF